MPRAIVLHPKDNVATLIDIGETGVTCSLQGEVAGTVTLRAAVPFGHKVCVRATAAGEDVFKYGQVIGQASKNLAIGDHVHIHNVESARGRGDRTGGRS